MSDQPQSPAANEMPSRLPSILKSTEHDNGPKLPSTSELLKMPSIPTNQIPRMASTHPKAQGSMLPSVNQITMKKGGMPEGQGYPMAPLQARPQGLPLSSQLPKPATPLQKPPSSLPSARQLGVKFPWHDDRQQTSLQQYKKDMKPNPMPSLQGLPQSSSYQSISSQYKSFQNSPLQGLRTNNLGKRYMEDPVI